MSDNLIKYSKNIRIVVSKKEFGTILGPVLGPVFGTVLNCALGSAERDPEVAEGDVDLADEVLWRRLAHQHLLRPVHGEQRQRAVGLRAPGAATARAEEAVRQVRCLHFQGN